MKRRWQRSHRLPRRKNVDMHREGCARKVRRCLNGLQGIERSVVADSRTHRVAEGRGGSDEAAASDPCCAQSLPALRRLHPKIEKRILRMKGGIFLVETGVQTAEPALKSSEVTVKGVFDSASLVAYVHKRQAAVVKQETEEKTKAADKEKKAEGEKDVKTENGLPFDQ
ncbi:unnamed protein product [Musa hybrid cultivar]